MISIRYVYGINYKNFKELKRFKMKIHFIFLTILLAISNMPILAQEAIFGGPGIVSPEVKENNTVIFRVKAPNAKEVQVSGEWMPLNGRDRENRNMIKEEDGTWTYTTEVLQPDLYGYSFIIDGFKTTDPNNPFLIRDASWVINVFIVGNGQGDLYKVNNIPHGTVARRWYNSPGNNKTRRITIYTPPGYEDDNKEYPVLYLLHGIGGDEEAWINLGRTAQIMDNLIAQGKSKPMIIVMPNGNVSQDAAPGEGSKGYYKPEFMVPNTMDGTYESTFTDIMKFVENKYRIKATKENRAIAGLSMGGFHSMHISRYYPNIFNYVGLFSPAIIENDSFKTAKAYQNINENLKIQMNNGLKLYWIAIGKDDSLCKNVADYRKKLDSLGMKYVYRESDGGHSWKNWRDYLTEFLPLLFQ